MRDDFEIIRIPLPRTRTVTIYPVADVHLGATECHEREWDAFRSRVLAEKDSYLILHGDLINNNTRSSVGSPYADMLRPREQKRRMAEHLEPLRDKILCCVSGNHERRSLKDADQDPTYDIMCKLDLEDRYRESMAFLYLTIGTRSQGEGRTGTHAAYNICVTHGAGGGALSGGVINRNERFARSICGVDALIVGHSHNGMISRPSQLVMDARTDRVTQRDIVVVATTSWQQFGGYAAQKMLQPRANSSAEAPMRLQLSGVRGQKYIKIIW